MMRSPLAYPLNRSADMDGGGAADLQTDIMRFMAILSLCLVAIFALVQSIPMTPAPPVEPEPQDTPVEPTPIIAKIPPAAPPKPAVPKTVEKPVENSRHADTSQMGSEIPTGEGCCCTDQSRAAGSGGCGYRDGGNATSDTAG